MLTDEQIQQIANKYLSFLENEMKTELMFFDGFDKKPYGNIFYYTSKKELERGDGIVYSSTGPFLVEKATGRIVTFGSTYPLEEYFKIYEDGTLEPTLSRYWYPETETYSHK
ncbi:hypothetical protein [Flavobacterium sp.]|uniref:hypothetical protein n=1 Tax=Flavobacterium sp. TaxID=239 RepID=UPI004048DA3B